MKAKSTLIQALIFTVFIGAFFVLHLALPDRDFSERENRVLQTAPRFTLSALFSGRFSSQAEDYVSDQFPFRDGWITLKARGELLSGKDENNGIFLCENETLIEPFSAPEDTRWTSGIAGINALARTAGAPVWFALIPTASEIWADKLPAGAPNDSQRDFIALAYSAAECETVDMASVLSAHAAEPVFYRTDHHWTTLGAYYGYTALARAMGFSPVPLNAYTEKMVTDSFYGTAWSSSGFSWTAPDAMRTYVEQGNARITNYPQGEAMEGSLYEESFLAKKDKYSYFYGGNTPRLVVETGSPGPKLLILRDSYMDSLSPFLFPHFSEIHILDLRYYRAGLYGYLSEQDFDAVLVCYSVKNFAEDTALSLLDA